MQQIAFESVSLPGSPCSCAGISVGFALPENWPPTGIIGWLHYRVLVVSKDPTKQKCLE